MSLNGGKMHEEELEADRSPFDVESGLFWKGKKSNLIKSADVLPRSGSGRAGVQQWEPEAQNCQAGTQVGPLSQ